MLQLIRKDFMVFFNRWNILFFIFFTFFILFQYNTTIPEGQYLVIASTVAFFLSASSFAYDEISQSDFIIQSLPVTRKEIVFAKYIGVIINSIIGILYATFLFILLNLFGLIDKGFLEMDIVVLVPFIVLFMTSLCFPLYFKIGYRKAKIANVLIFVSFFMVMNALMVNLNEAKLVLMSFMETSNLEVMILSTIIIIAILSIALSLKLYTSKDL